MKNYDPNVIHNGVHKIRVALQQWDYVGHITYDMGGNCKGRDVLDFDFEISDGDEENDCNLTFYEDEGTFSAVLTNESGDKLEVEGTPSDMNDMIVAIEIMEYAKHNSNAVC